MSNPRIGKMIGAYRVERTLGGGGMGTVYLVEHAALRQPRALKVLNAPPGLSEQELEERYLREPQLVASLSHPNIIPVTDAGVDQGAPYLVMPLIEGEDLRARVEEEGPLRPAQAVRIVAAVGAALDAVHDRGIVHRDVKPGNVMLADDGGVYLTDFGIAKANVADPAASVRFAGTYAYAAPEQVKGESVDARTDVYGLACTLVYCLTGNPPYEGSEWEMGDAHVRSGPPRVSAKRPDLGSHLDLVIGQAMAKDPQSRYPTCSAFTKAVREALPTKSHGGDISTPDPSAEPEPVAARGAEPREETIIDSNPGPREETVVEPIAGEGARAETIKEAPPARPRVETSRETAPATLPPPPPRTSGNGGDDGEGGQGVGFIREHLRELLIAASVLLVLVIGGVIWLTQSSEDTVSEDEVFEVFSTGVLTGGLGLNNVERASGDDLRNIQEVGGVGGVAGEIDPNSSNETFICTIFPDQAARERALERTGLKGSSGKGWWADKNLVCALEDEGDNISKNQPILDRSHDALI